MSTRSFKYQERPKEAWRERANMKGGQFDTYIKPAYKLYKAKDGKNVIRILPPTWEGKLNHYGYDIHVNYQIGPDNQSYLSLSKMLGKPDPIAEARAQAEREGDEALAKALRPTHRILMWIIDRLDEEQGPLLYPAPFSKVDKAFINLAYDPETGLTQIDHPEEGCDIRFYKEGANLSTDYPASKMRLLESGPISDDEKKQQQWLDYITENPVPDCLQYYSYEHISGVFNGGAPKPRDEDPEPAPRAKKPEPEEEVEAEPAPRSRKQPEPEPEEEAEPEPVSRRARPRVAEPEAEAPKSGSIRDRIRARHSRPAAED